MSARDLIRRAVAVPSVSGQEAEVSRLLVDWMNAHDFRARTDAVGNAVGVRGNGPRTVVLLGHIDTVPGEVPVREEGSLLYGRGSVDAKGSFCCFVAAVARLPQAALEAARFVCIGAVEEEVPSSRGARHAVTEHAPDLVLIGEPSGWDAITLGYKGRLVVKVTVRKDNFHSAGEGSSAGDDLLEYAVRARRWAASWGESRGLEGAFSTVQLTVQDLGSVQDGLEQRAYATLGLRLPPGLDPHAAEHELRALGIDLEALSLEFTGHEVAYRGEKDNALTRALRVAIREAGGTPRFKLKTGTSDMNVVAPHWPVPMVAYGPGDSALDHTPIEHLDLEEFERSVNILSRALERIAVS
ncbi:LysW-gamma-L-lysine carboxypeptidase [Deinobacterium chartae]|uniref:[LysW]-lysine hydrolase n=1 Tax=Deinobacterium chartae TaxID=521158 RepID=A0A841HZ44_9DEIO|nr:LysW-gamma-L-lysine carboxypeptidase [Deinobacterium chartae]